MAGVDGDAVGGADGEVAANADRATVGGADGVVVASADGEVAANADRATVGGVDGEVVASADGEVAANADRATVGGVDGVVVASADRVMPVSADREVAGGANGATVARAAKKGAVAAAPAHASQRASRGYIQRDVRRNVFARDGEQCSYVDAEGERCPARAFLQLDHIHPTGLGGSDEEENLRVRCFTHNQLYAEQVYGRRYVDERIHFRRRKYGRAGARPPGAAARPTFDMAARDLRSLGFRDREVRWALAMLEKELDAAPVDTILRAALFLLT